MATFSESILDALQSSVTNGYPAQVYSDSVFHLDNGVLGGTLTYEWWFDRSLGCLYDLLNESSIDASDLISYFFIEEIQD